MCWEPVHRSPQVRAQGSGLRVQGSGFRAQGSGLRAQGSGIRAQGSGLRAQGSGQAGGSDRCREVGWHVTCIAHLCSKPRGSSCH